MMVISSLLSVVFTTAGLYLSYRFNWTSGAAIIMVAAAGFFLSLAISAIRSRLKPGSARQAS